MVKMYLRYEPAAAFGVIVSVESNITYDSSGKHLLVPALEKLGVWHVRQGVCTKILSPSPSSRGPSLAVTYVASSSLSPVASGYADVSIRIWDCDKGSCETTLNGHKGVVTALRYNKVGSLLGSGSKDNNVILWDVVGETGLFRLCGHRDQHCMQIVSGHHSEIWSIDVDPDESYLVTGSADLELRFYNVKHDSRNGESVLNVAGKTVEIFRVLDETESKRKAKCRFNRKKEKKSAKEVVEATENVEANHGTEEAGSVSVVTFPDVFKLLQTVRASKKICSISFYPVTPKNSLDSLALSLNNNFLLLSFKGTVLMSEVSQTFDSGYGPCGLIVPHNKYAMVGTKDGKIEIIDVDHDEKFWEYQIKQKSGQDSKRLTKSNVRTMKMNDDVLVVAVSPDAKYVAVALLDCTVKVLFMDSLKFFLSLHGHKLPVLCMDLGSGFCVMAVQFVCNTHYMFSAGKDRLVKYWDADKFELLLTLEGHHADVWCLAISNRGDFVVTGSHDRSIRRWDRTEKPFFIEEEKEKRLEEMFEADIDNAFEDRHVPKEELPEEGAVALAGKKTQETLTAADSIIDTLDVAEVELKRLAEHEEEKTRGKVAEFRPNTILLGLSPSEYVLRALSNISTNDLEQTLLVELVCRIVTVLLQAHHSQLISTPSAKPVLTVLKEILYARVKECKDTLGFNLAAMDHLKQLMASRSDALFRDAKSKLLEICSQQSKRLEARTETKTEKQKKKKQKKSTDMHVWT
ncbi:hypothetical protein CRYUN_Cryun05aG0232500 [Craigia yunnanensis]